MINKAMVNKVIAIFMVFTLLFTASFSISTSAQQYDPVNDIELTKAEQKQAKKLAKEIEKELKFYFEEVGQLTDYGYQIVDTKLFNEKLAEEDETAMQIAKIIGYDPNPSDIQAFGATEFASCVVDEFEDSYGGIARMFATGTIYSYIKAKEYDIAAQQIAKVLMKAGFKVNAAGVAVEIGIYAWTCRGEW